MSEKFDKLMKVDQKLSEYEEQIKASFEKAFSRVRDKNGEYPFSLDFGEKQFNRTQLIGCHGTNNPLALANGKPQNQKAVAALAAENRKQVSPQELSKIILLGDNFYPNGLPAKSRQKVLDMFQSGFKEVGYCRSLAILGNHDWATWSQAKSVSLFSDTDWNTGAFDQVMFTYDKVNEFMWLMPNRYYHQTTPHAEFYFIDSTTFPFDRHQQAWLQSILKYHSSSACPEKHNRFKILVSHHPLVTIGKRNRYGHHRVKDAAVYAKRFDIEAAFNYLTNEFISLEQRAWNEVLLDSLKTVCVYFDCVFSAHDHGLASYYMHFSGGKKVLQIVSGGGGGNLQPFKGYYQDHQELGKIGLVSDIYFHDGFGYVDVRFTESRDKRQAFFEYVTLGKKPGEKGTLIEITKLKGRDFSGKRESLELMNGRLFYAIEEKRLRRAKWPFSKNLLKFAIDSKMRLGEVFILEAQLLKQEEFLDSLLKKDHIQVVFVFHHGPDEETIYQEIISKSFKECKICFFSVLGPLDWQLNGYFSPAYRQELLYDTIMRRQGKPFYMPNRYYKVALETVDFYCIDSTSFLFDRPQQDWLDGLLRQADPQKNKILVSYHPLLMLPDDIEKLQANRERYAEKMRQLQGNDFTSLVFNAEKGLLDMTFLSFALEKVLARYPFDAIISAHSALVGFTKTGRFTQFYCSEDSSMPDIKPVPDSPTLLKGYAPIKLEFLQQPGLVKIFFSDRTKILLLKSESNNI